MYFQSILVSQIKSPEAIVWHNPNRLQTVNQSLNNSLMLVLLRIFSSAHLKIMTSTEVECRALVLLPRQRIGPEAIRPLSATQDTKFNQKPDAQHHRDHAEQFGKPAHLWDHYAIADV